MVNIVVCYSWIGSFDVRSLNSCKCVARWILCHYWLLREMFGCFERNFENTGRMQMFSMPGESDLVESFMFGHVYFHSVIWNE